jgi:hypothetical protein
MENPYLAFLRSPALSEVMSSVTTAFVAHSKIANPRSRRAIKRIAVLSCACCVLLFSGSQLHAAEKAAWTASPSAIYQQKGVYPTTVILRLFWNGCVSGDNGLPKSNQLGQYYSVSITGSGVTASSPTVDDCSLTTTLTIGPSAAPGLQAVNVTQLASQDAKSGTGKGFAELSLMDATAGPTPNGPEVDVLWEVLTDNLCKDNFGNRMPSQLFCVDVKIGNNTGHNLQLAGLGFTRKSPDCVGPKKDDLTTVVRQNCTGTPGEEISIPNVGYQVARASEQYGSQITTRNIIANSIQGLGLLMASFTPFFENTSSKSKWSTGAAIVGTSITQAINLVAPDLTVRELQNLDDQAFRDGKLIPNNTQVRLLVFVQKKSLAEAIGEIVPQIKAANQKQMTPCPEGYKPVSGTAGACYPAWEDSFKDCLKKLACNPMIVKLALGRMVIIGDKIDYIQRIVVDSNVTSQEVPAGGGAQPAKVQQAQVAFTSPNTAQFAVGKATSFTIKVTGTPTPSLSADSLPSGVTFVDNKDGTATLSGTPVAGTAGKRDITITAHNGTSTDVTQTLTLTINP